MTLMHDLRVVYNESPWLFWILAICCIVMGAGYLEGAMLSV